MIGGTIYIVGKEVSNGEYADGTPCLICSRMIKNAGINTVVYLDKNGNTQYRDANDLKSV